MDIIRNRRNKRPVVKVDQATNEILKVYNSLYEASKKEKVPLSRIQGQCQYCYKSVTADFFFRYIEDVNNNTFKRLDKLKKHKTNHTKIKSFKPVKMLHKKTGLLISYFSNISMASKKTGIPQSTINFQCTNEITKTAKHDYIFRYVEV